MMIDDNEDDTSSTSAEADAEVKGSVAADEQLAPGFEGRMTDAMRVPWG